MPYEEKDQKIFFGRDAEQKILVDKILSNKLTLFFAETGVGKSSLLQASVVPYLKHPARKNLDVVYYKDWVSNPVAELKKTTLDLLKARGKLSSDYSPDEDLNLEDFFQVCSVFSNEPLVIMLDQFEEFFQYQRYSDAFLPFVEQLSQSIRDRETPVAFVISMREDYALNLNAFKEYLPTTLFENYYRLEKLTLEKAEEAIRRPVERIGFSYEEGEEGLVEDLLRDLANREKESRLGSRSVSMALDAPSFVEPPHLQIVCKRLWEEEKGNPDGLIKKTTYEDKGRAKGFVDSYFKEIIQSFSASEKKLASRSFNHLVTPRGTRMAYPVEDLSERLRVNETDLKNVLEKLEDGKVLRRQSREGVDWYELYHDTFGAW
jgi:hypothetical protein